MQHKIIMKSVTGDFGAIEYMLEIKNVKNINLRIKPDGEIYVSANRRIPESVIDEFVISKADFIINAVNRFKDKKPQTEYYSEEELKRTILCISREVYPYFEKRGVEYPQIKFRNMKSRWGSCIPKKGILTFNTRLAYAPYECVRYVVLHEFTHFLQANHSRRFYEELALTCPDWKACRKKLREIT